MISRFICTLLIYLVCSGVSLKAQDYTVNFAKGTKQFEVNTSTLTSINQIGKEEIFKDHFYRFVQFNAIPTASEQVKIAAAGIQLLEYIPNMLYVASIPTNINFNNWEALNIRSIVPIDFTYKIGPRLENQDYPSWSMDGKHVVVSIQYFQDIDVQTITSEFAKRGVQVLHHMHHAQIVEAKLLPAQVQKLAKASFIRYIDVRSEPGHPESDDGRHLHRSNVIDGDYWGARNYDGTGINVAVNDDGFAGPHIDFRGRTNQQSVASDFAGDHGDMVAGIVGGAGNLDPQIRGMATGTYMHIRQYSASLPGTITLHQDSAVMVFNSSYSNGCNAGYTNTTVLVDQEIYNNPNLMQVFSAGNSNGNNCGYGAGNQWGNITGGHKVGKNVIATANLRFNDVIETSSSRGPANDGRIKPDISAHGTSHMSTDPNNTYASGGGTSAAAPGIAGVMAQLYDAYAQNNAGNTAPSALLKLAMLATANDLGNDGPDFIFGWGKVNGLRAAQVLEENRYFNGSITQGGSNTHNITIPTGVKRAKIMVYWVDKEGSSSSSIALVNDLDATVTDPGATVHMPWVLDHSPSATALALPATKGADHLNNMEQIAIDNPTAGTYVLDISGTTVPFGAQEYWVVYEFMTDEITLVHPIGGEGLVPSTTERIHWDAYGTTGTFDVEFSTDGGTNWIPLSTGLSGSTRFVNWNIPNLVSGQMKVRVTRGAFSDESSTNFTIINRPNNLRTERVCPSIGAIQVAWDAVPGATGYDVFLLGQKYMDSVGTTSNLFFDVPVANVDAPQWFSVRAIGPNGIRGLRQVAQYFGGTQGGTLCFLECGGDNDAGIQQILTPQVAIEPCAGNTSVPVSILLENIGLFDETNFSISYQLGNAPIVTETFTDTITKGGTTTFTFATQATIPAVGTYILKVWTNLSGDVTSCNDTVSTSIDVLLPFGGFPYVEDFQGTIFPPANSFIVNAGNSMTWEQAIGFIVGAQGGFTKCMVCRNYEVNAYGQEDIFSTVSMDMTTATTAQLTFDVAYRLYNFLRSDNLRVDVSLDCGQSWQQIFFKGGATLATSTPITSSWTPLASNQWRNETVDLTPYVGNHITLRFVNINGNGNNLYIDNINVNAQNTTGFSSLGDDFEINLSPNPAQNETMLHLNSALDEDMSIELMSVDGKILSQQQLIAGETTLSVNLRDLSAGIYLVRLSTTNATEVRKLIVD